MPRKVAHKVSDHSDGGRVVLWRKWAFHIAFYIINFLEGIFIFKPCILYPFKRQLYPSNVIIHQIFNKIKMVRFLSVN
jgi:hypothetical protein